jgi:hypothetical protein
MVSYALVISSEDPTTFQEAVNSQEKSKWMGAMAEEMESLHKNQTWDLVELPERKRKCNTPSPLRLGLSLFFFYNKIFAKIHKVYQST